MRTYWNLITATVVLLFVGSLGALLPYFSLNSNNVTGSGLLLFTVIGIAFAAHHPAVIAYAHELREDDTYRALDIFVVLIFTSFAAAIYSIFLLTLLDKDLWMALLVFPTLAYFWYSLAIALLHAREDSTVTQKRK